MLALPRVQRMFTVEPFAGLGPDFSQVVDQLFNADESATETRAYGVDVREDAEHLYLEAELPGLKKEEIEVTLEKSTLTIAAEHKTEQTSPPTGEWLLRERRTARFNR